jgi:hypothetical protein
MKPTATLQSISIRCALALASFLAAAPSAHADIINVVGETSGALATANVFTSFNSQTNTFTFTVVNTSPFDAQITGIGYDLPPIGNASASGLNGFAGSVTFQPAGVSFDFSDADLGTVPVFGSVVLDFGFLTGSSFGTGNTSVGLPPGIDPGDEATFVVSGAAFSGFTEAQISNGVYVRFESVGAAGTGVDVGDAFAAAPEPAATALLGLALAAGWRRRRRNVQ